MPIIANGTVFPPHACLLANARTRNDIEAPPKNKKDTNVRMTEN
jgi:hypothetical protein